ncbi:hypothetical protein LTR78_004114 [Recurvomyces mirabilis]|uniref:Uncharacterized protein n=1 Tax=Recurvomyces mirabilis TaxID=574656 RepID=A0AAE0WQC9_9PEZI|nr:hypothetical protein LTR78_004114 [Recurvomyces mirabilis]KAK5153714.1 hypothetical protein LTS14_007408 [Recurvomyces mirabilis]
MSTKSILAAAVAGFTAASFLDTQQGPSPYALIQVFVRSTPHHTHIHRISSTEKNPGLLAGTLPYAKTAQMIDQGGCTTQNAGDEACRFTPGANNVCSPFSEISIPLAVKSGEIVGSTRPGVVCEGEQ